MDWSANPSRLHINLALPMYSVPPIPRPFHLYFFDRPCTWRLAKGRSGGRRQTSLSFKTSGRKQGTHPRRLQDGYDEVAKASQKGYGSSKEANSSEQAQVGTTVLWLAKLDVEHLAPNRSVGRLGGDVALLWVSTDHGCCRIRVVRILPQLAMDCPVPLTFFSDGWSFR
jgi:hypothetical protein